MTTVEEKIQRLKETLALGPSNGYDLELIAKQIAKQKRRGKTAAKKSPLPKKRDPHLRGRAAKTQGSRQFLQTLRDLHADPTVIKAAEQAVGRETK